MDSPASAGTTDRIAARTLLSVLRAGSGTRARYSSMSFGKPPRFVIDEPRRATVFFTRTPYFAAFPRFRSDTHLGSPLRDSFGGTPARKLAQRNSRAGSSPVCAILTAISATAFTIQLKFSWPTDVISASGAGFRKSIAYGTPPSTANSTVLRSYPSTRHRVSASFSILALKASDDGGGFPFTYRS